MNEWFNERIYRWLDDECRDNIKNKPIVHGSLLIKMNASFEKSSSVKIRCIYRVSALSGLMVIAHSLRNEEE